MSKNVLFTVVLLLTTLSPLQTPWSNKLFSGLAFLFLLLIATHTVKTKFNNTKSILNYAREKQKSTLILSVAAFAAITLSLLFNAGEIVSNTPTSIIRLLSTATAYLFFPLAYLTFKHCPPKQSFVHFIILFGILILGLFQYFIPDTANSILMYTTAKDVLGFPDMPITSVFPINTTFGPISALFAVVAALKARESQNKTDCWTYGIITLLASTCTILSVSRTAILALAIGTLTLILRSKLSLVRTGAAVLGTALTLILITIFHTPFAMKTGEVLPFTIKLHDKFASTAKSHTVWLNKRIKQRQKGIIRDKGFIHANKQRIKFLTDTAPQTQQVMEETTHRRKSVQQLQERIAEYQMWLTVEQDTLAELTAPISIKDFIPNLPSNNKRIILWKAAFKTWISHPLLGIGLGQFYIQSEKLLPQNGPAIHNAHSLFLGLLVEGGLTLVIPLSILCFTAFRKSPHYCILTVILFVSLFENLFDHSLAWNAVCAWSLANNNPT